MFYWIKTCVWWCGLSCLRWPRAHYREEGGEAPAKVHPEGAEGWICSSDIWKGSCGGKLQPSSGHLTQGNTHWINLLSFFFPFPYLVLFSLFSPLSSLLPSFLPSFLLHIPISFISLFSSHRAWGLRGQLWIFFLLELPPRFTHKQRKPLHVKAHWLKSQSDLYPRLKSHTFKVKWCTSNVKSNYMSAEDDSAAVALQGIMSLAFWNFMGLTGCLQTCKYVHTKWRKHFPTMKRSNEGEGVGGGWDTFAYSSDNQFPTHTRLYCMRAFSFQWIIKLWPKTATLTPFKFHEPERFCLLIPTLTKVACARHCNEVQFLVEKHSVHIIHPVLWDCFGHYSTSQ